MEQLTKIAELLGEDNAKRLKDTITDMIIEQVKSDMDNMTVYLIDFEAVLDGIRRDIERDVRERLANEYVEVLRKRLDDYFGLHMKYRGVDSLTPEYLSMIDLFKNAKIDEFKNPDFRTMQFNEGESHYE